MGRAVLVLLAAAAWATGCAAAEKRRASSPRDADPRCVASHPRVLVATWPADEQQRIEAAVLSPGLLVARVSCAGVTLLSGCSLDGDYRYLGTRPRESEVALEAPRQIAVNTGGRALGRDLRVLRLLRVGRISTTRRTANRAQLRGDCAGATHFATGVSLGAVDLGSSETLGSCRALGAGTELPPPQCRRFLRLELTSLEAERPEGIDPALRHCPRGWRWDGARCIERRDELAFECVGDARECAVQCERGDAASCARLGALLARGEGGLPRNQGRATALYERACADGFSLACYELGRLIAVDGAPGVNERAEPLLAAACDDGVAAACSQLGVLRSRASPRTTEIVLDSFLRGCAGGDAMGCFQAGRLGRALGASSAYTLDLEQRACEGDVAEACFESALILLAQRGPKEPVLSLLRRACGGGHATACALLARTSSGT